MKSLAVMLKSLRCLVVSALATTAITLMNELKKIDSTPADGARMAANVLMSVFEGLKDVGTSFEAQFAAMLVLDELEKGSLAAPSF
ncbi:MAG TPA: hypothetical protein V6C97_19130 [Oculatellaceae cyanobacterium]